MATVNEKMTAIADEIRTLSGTTGTMGLDAMASNVSDANTEISDQANVMEEILTALEGKAGGSGVELPALTNEGIASDLLSGKQLINSQNQVIIGTNPYEKSATDAEVDTQADLISQIKTALESGGSGSLDTSTVNILFTGSGSPDYAYISGTQVTDSGIQPFYAIFDKAINKIPNSFTITNILKNSSLVIGCTSRYQMGEVVYDQCEELYKEYSINTISVSITGNNATITIRNDY